ncbi:ABC transporter ATP-binding protein [Brachyspira hampsonii]|uniref:ABC transporter ATP-binding protein n=1 Tax=Brachyspira hampsonii TaxID=1287055 RepID=A0A1E5NEH9_9SPIR|nr:YoaK family protein [Brachyspira hampsonii]OEJ14558.1 ABC transporter ATP-binding protein [Brachyspira hampsonii]
MKNNIIAFIKRKNESIHTTETIYVASILTMVGGFVDAYTYITRGGVFAYAQTGNIIFFAMGLVKKQFNDTLHYFMSIIIFVIGIFFALYIKQILNKRKIIEFEYVIILIHSIVLFIVGLLPQTFSDTVIVGSISFMSAIFMITFNKVEGLSYVTNMCTGNLRSASENIFKFLFNKDKTGLKKGLMYITILCSFALGAFLGTLFTNIFGIRAIWISSALLLVVESLMFFEK